ncbi:MAG: sulfotransferase, partial [Erythrobacter sp.]|nr:sulfotransferase [Erythrobacter sp.]
MAELADHTVATMWRRGITERPPLDPDFLWAKGSEGFSPQDEVSIRSDEDVADFRARLDILCRSLRDEAALNALGHTMAYGQIVAAIRKRHALGRLWRERPELATTPIAPPIAVVGQMRAGTTRVHRLLAADPRHAGTRFCNAVDPVPVKKFGIDWRPLKTRTGLAIARLVNPWLDTQHPFGARRADEELGWLTTALDVVAFEAQWHIPGFVAFAEARDAAPLYREFARILRTDAALMGNADRPRILKCPKFAEDLPALIEHLPETRLVVT